MDMTITKEFVRHLISSEENIDFNNVLSTTSEVFFALILILIAVTIIAIILITQKKGKRKSDSTPHFKEIPETITDKKMHSSEEPEIPQNIMELEDLKGIGTKTAEKLKAANIKTVSDLAKGSAKILSQKTGISEKLLSKWIKQANLYKTKNYQPH